MYCSLATILFLLAGYIASVAQFAPQFPLPGHTTISKNDSRFTDWAAGCTFYPGWVNMADKSLGKTDSTNTGKIVGPPGIYLLSLGDSGVVVLTFEHSIKNGPGPDFAVFENGFTERGNDTVAFLELAFVEVSSDGQNFIRFPAISLMQDTMQIDNATFSDARYYHNLAGKYIAGYGTPFDLEDLKDTPGLDINNITHVRIVDVIGSIDPEYGSYDHEGRMINDPFPTPFLTSGFDLNGVGVINSNKPVSVTGKKKEENDIMLFPNPVSDRLHISIHGQQSVPYTLHHVNGAEVKNSLLPPDGIIDMSHYANGIYILQLYLKNGASYKNRVIKR